MMTRITVNLQASERSALLALAEIEKRNPRAQAALIIRTELERRGLLSPEMPPTNGQPGAASTRPAEAGHWRAND